MPAALQDGTPRMPAKQRMAVSLKSIASSIWGRGGGGAADGPPPMGELFVKTSREVDGEACEHDCESCNVKYPRGFKIDEEDVLYGHVKGWDTHLLVGTSKSDWVRDVADEKGSVMEAIEKAEEPSNGTLKVSASNMCTTDDTSDYAQPTHSLLLPAFILVDNVHPTNVSLLIRDIISHAPTSASPLAPITGIPASVPSPAASGLPPLVTRPCPHSAVILMCSQRTRDARCGQSAPLLRRELERHLRPLGLYRDLHDERPGGVGIYFINHVGGHKYSANVMVYRRPNAFGQDELPAGAEEAKAADAGEGEVGAGQFIWLARVTPQDCENLVRFTVLKGKVVKPESQLRGGFDRAKGLISW